MTEDLAKAPLSELLSDLVVVAYRSVRLGSSVAGDRGSPAVWRTLSVLVSQGPLRLGELAQQSRVSQPTMTKIVQSLTAAGWITRALDPLDARATQLRLTPAGSSALTEWRTRLGDALAPSFSDLDDEDREVLERAVQILHGVLLHSIHRDPDTQTTDRKS